MLLCRVAARHAETGVGDPTGKLVGKAALRAYFQEALDKLSNLKLDLQVRHNSMVCQSAVPSGYHLRHVVPWCVRVQDAASLSHSY
jgi:hypothetical protein